MDRILIYSTDSNYADYTKVSLLSFLHHNPGWKVLVMDVGMTPEQVAWFSDYATVETQTPDPERRVLFIPSGLARVQMLSRFAGEGKLLFYLDGDTLIYGSVEPMIERFLASGKPFGLGAEDNWKVWWAAKMHKAWKGPIPEEDLPRWRTWQREPVMNTGVLLATGPEAAKVSALAMALYQKHRLKLVWSEQTAIDSAIYELGFPYHQLSLQEHYFGREWWVSHPGRRRYIDGTPRVFGQEVLIRHFCHTNKKLLKKLFPKIRDHWLGHAGQHAEPRKHAVGVSHD